MVSLGSEGDINVVSTRNTVHQISSAPFLLQWPSRGRCGMSSLQKLDLVIWWLSVHLSDGEFLFADGGVARGTHFYVD